jgi:peptidoglycan/LPS O-acetylase OafA/YrhL
MSESTERSALAGVPGAREDRDSTVDVWRTVAIAMVVASHLMLASTDERVAHGPWVAGFSWIGHLGVLLFFFISGFVVSLTALREVANTAQFSVSAFYGRRAARILPPFLIYWAAVLVLSLTGLADTDAVSLVRGASFTCNTSLLAPHCSWFLGHTWSLAFEEQFYLLFPLAFAAWAIGQRRPGWALLALLVVLLPAVFPVAWIGRVGFIEVHTLFLSGCLAAIHRRAVLDRLRPFRRPVFVAAAIALFFPYWSFERLDVALGGKALTILAIAAIVMASLAVDGPAESLLRRAAAWVGRRSYTIYLWQQAVLHGGVYAMGTSAMVAAVIGLVVWSELSFRWIEQPIIRYARRRMAAGRASPAGTGATAEVPEPETALR